MAFSETNPLSESQVLLYGRSFSPHPPLEEELKSVDRVLERVLGPENILVIRAASLNPWVPVSPVEMMKLSRVPLLNKGRDYPRDAHIILGDNLIIKPDAWWISKDYPNSFHSELGEGGAVVYHRNIVLVADGKWGILSYEDTRSQLNGMGYIVSHIPSVYPTQGNVPDHIDGHVALIKEKGNNLVLLVAESYFNQNEYTGNRLKKVTKETGLDLKVVETRLPLELNLVQFQDGAVIMTGETSELERMIKDLAGHDRVFTTDIPLIEMPQRKLAGIRCVTNIVPRSLTGKKC